MAAIALPHKLAWRPFSLLKSVALLVIEQPIDNASIATTIIDDSRFIATHSFLQEEFPPPQGNVPT